MIITKVNSKSIAHQLELQVGDAIVKINGQPIKDIIDYRFHISDEHLKLQVDRHGQTLIFEVDKDPQQDLGVTFNEMKFRSCGSKCIFCFVDQNPRGLRPSLYFKDEDFRLSFLYGNYVTLTNVSRRDLKRIVSQRLSPLYISVHATDRQVRQKLLRLKKDDALLDKIDFLTKHGIDLHAQIVLCPTINDGRYLENTITKLAQFYPRLKSVAVVPVGLTKFREGLYPLKPVDATYSNQIIDWLDHWADTFRKKLGSYFIYLADEFYLMADRKLPPSSRYEDFHQIENGVGMTRYFLNRFYSQSQSLPKHIQKPAKIILVTGTLARNFMQEKVIARLNQVKNLQPELHVVTNHFFGPSISVTGLLTGTDIFNSLKDRKKVDAVFLPANCLNYEGKLLDDWTPEILEKRLGLRIKILDNDFTEIFKHLSSV